MINIDTSATMNIQWKVTKVIRFEKIQEIKMVYFCSGVVTPAYYVCMVVVPVQPISVLY
jgi:hypothetical protein